MIQYSHVIGYDTRNGEEYIEILAMIEDGLLVVNRNGDRVVVPDGVLELLDDYDD